MPKSYEPTFPKEMRDSLPVLRGFENKLRQGKFVVPPQDRAVTLAKRKARKKQAKERKQADALVQAAARRNKRKRILWWVCR